MGQEQKEQIASLKAEIKALEDKVEYITRLHIEKENALVYYKRALEKEKVDVEALEKETFLAALAKIMRCYDKKYEKEYNEYLRAKQSYDAFLVELETIVEEKQRLQVNLQDAKNQLKILKESFYRNNPQAQLEEEKERTCLYQKKKELQEAIEAVTKVKHLAQEVYKAYDSAKGWATYDTFLGGGFLGDLMKYGKIDEAESLTHKMKAAAKYMEKELLDVDVTFHGDFEHMDGITRTFDMVFDNIFTDWSVKEHLAQNLQVLANYQRQLEGVIEQLRNALVSVEIQIKETL